MTKNKVIADILRMISVEFEKRKYSKEDLDETVRSFVERQAEKKAFGDALSIIMEYAEKEMGLSEDTVFLMRKGEWSGK